MKMNLEDVKKEVIHIQEIAGDDEVAHSSEDDLHQAVLKEVVLGNPESVEMAKEALKTLGISFCRWCA